MAELVVTDHFGHDPITIAPQLIDTLLQENRQLSRDLKITEKLLESYRKCLQIFASNCVCHQNDNNRLKSDSLDKYYDQYIESKTNRSDIQTEHLRNDDILVANQSLLETISSVNLEHEVTDECPEKSKEECDASQESKMKRLKVSEFDDMAKMFACEWDGCDRSFDDNFHLQRHVRAIHTLEKPFDCRECDKSFSRSDHLLKHVRTSHEDYQSFKCRYKDCKYETIFENKMIAHEDKHKIPCKECELKFCSQTEMNCHFSNCHKERHKTRKKINKRLKEEADGEEVSNQKYNDDINTFSNLPKKILRGMELKSRLKSFRGKYLSRQEVMCEEVGCEKVFKCIQNMRKHVKTVHLGLRPFPCDWPGCESAFKTREAMTNHKSVHCEERNFKCEFDGCNKSFKLKCKLTQHLRCHGIGPKNDRFPCSWPACGIFCQSEQALTEHLNRHQNIRPFVCLFNGCGKAYFTSFELKQHSMKFHEQNESFKCDYRDCPMVYLNKRDLSKHRRLHDDMARFICSWPECSHTFNTSKELDDHMNRHMDIRANKCNFIGCGRSYFTRKDLSRHIRKSHS